MDCERASNGAHVYQYCYFICLLTKHTYLTLAESSSPNLEGVYSLSRRTSWMQKYQNYSTLSMCIWNLTQMSAWQNVLRWWRNEDDGIISWTTGDTIMNEMSIQHIPGGSYADDESGHQRGSQSTWMLNDNHRITIWVHVY